MPQSFDSFFQAGFECSSHRRRDGVRLDLIKATAHDKHVLRDYRQCAELGFRTIRHSFARAVTDSKSKPMALRGRSRMS